jgi:polysaccharide export outer membrane protein
MGAIAMALLALVPGLALATQSAESAPTPATGEATASYVIGPSDVLQIFVWKEPDLTQEVTVRFDGMITVPLLGDQTAAGFPPAELAANLEKEFSRYVEGPRVNVVVMEARSARFFVLGEVARPGEFPLAGPTTVLQALALAGGLREYAKKDSIIIIREDRQVIPVNYDHLSEGKDVSGNVPLLPGDTIVVR